MIKVTVFKEGSTGNLKGYSFKGHAGFDDTGKDIVCSAASVLAINTANSIEKFADDETEVISSGNEGDLTLKFKGVPSENAVLLVNSMVLGVESIIESYGENFISLSFKEV